MLTGKDKRIHLTREYIKKVSKSVEKMYVNGLGDAAAGKPMLKFEDAEINRDDPLSLAACAFGYELYKSAYESEQRRQRA